MILPDSPDLFNPCRAREPEYLADRTPGWEGILKHGVYHTRKNLGVDQSVMWGEFFFVEALSKVLKPDF